MKKYFLVLIAIFLVGCQSQRSPAAQRCVDTTPAATAARWNCLTQANQADKQQAAISSLQSRCDAFGFKRGTEAYSNCLLQLNQQDMANNADAAERERRAWQDAERMLSPNRGVVNCYRAPGSSVTTCQ